MAEERILVNPGAAMGLLLRPSTLDLELAAGCRLGSSQSRGQHAIGRTRDVVESDGVEELDARRLSPVLAADADLDLCVRLAGADRRAAHELADSGAVENGEGVLLQDSRLNVRRQELVDIVARESVGCLREVVGSEA